MEEEKIQRFAIVFGMLSHLFYDQLLADLGCSGDLVLLDTMLDSVESFLSQQSQVVGELS